MQFYLGVGIINLFGDICILTVPISNVMKLRLEKTQKIAISFIFMLGSLYVYPTLTTSALPYGFYDWGITRSALLITIVYASPLCTASSRSLGW